MNPKRPDPRDYFGVAVPPLLHINSRPGTLPPTPGLTAAPPPPRRRFIIGAAIAAVIAAVAAITIWAWPTSDTSNPGAAFAGVYEATYTTTLVNGKPTNDSKPRNYRWAVRSHCPTVDGPCIASISSADVTNPGGRPISFLADYSDGSWTTAVKTGEATCPSPDETEQRRGPRWSTINWGTTSEDNGDDYAGTHTEYRGIACRGSSETSIVIRRVYEDVDPTIAFPTLSDLAPYVTEPPGYALQGKYEIVTAPRPISATIKINPPPARTIRITAKTTCGRDGNQCGTAITYDDGSSDLWIFENGKWTQDSAYLANCFTEKDIAAKYKNHVEYTRTDNMVGPITTLTGTQTEGYADPCDYTAVTDIKVTRIGD